MTYAEKFINAQRQIAYKQGQKAHGNQVAKQQAQVRKNRSAEGADTSKGKVHFEGDRAKLNKTQRASLDAMEVLAKALGVQIYVESFEGIENANKNGWYDPKDGSIHININAGAGSKGTMLFTVSHELTHFIRQWSPAKFEVLANFLVKQYGEQGVPVSDLIDAQIADAKADNRDLTREEALEEVVADSMETMLADGSIIEMMAELKQQDQSLWQKICDWFKDLAGKIQAVVDAYKGVQPDSTEGRMVADMKDIIGTLEALYMDALVDASENFDGGVQKITTEDSGGVKYSHGQRTAQADITVRYQTTVDQILNMQNTNKDHLIIGYTPDIYRSLGMPSLPFVIGTGHVYSAAKTEAEARQDGNFRKGIHYHGLGANTIKNIYEALKDPVMIIASKDVSKNATPLRSTHSVVAIVDVGNGQKSLLLPVEITAERTVDGVRMDVNALSSIYERDVTPLIKEAIAQENTGDVGVYYAKKEALTLPGAGVRFPIRLQQSIASNGIIHSFSEKVNMNIRDVVQSQQFKRWFGDWQNHPVGASKIVNADGTPKVMYHGSPAQFAVFDKKKAKNSGLYGKGFYFTDSTSHAGTYGQRYDVYLNIRNPLEHGKSTVTHDQVRAFLEAVAENEDYSIENYGTYDVDAILKNILGGKTKIDAFQVLQDINATAIGDLVEAVELFNKVNGTKFDGIVVPTETVAFYPEQIKSATDNIGTFDGSNPDIRYSQRDVGRQEAVTQALEKENAKLREDVTELRELVSLQRQVTNGTKFTKTSVEAAARYLKQNANAKGDTKGFAKLLNGLYEYIASTKELTWEGVKEQAQGAVDWLWEHIDRRGKRSDYAWENNCHGGSLAAYR